MSYDAPLSITRVIRKVIMTKKSVKKEEELVKYIYFIPLENGVATIPFCVGAGGDVASKAKTYIMDNNLYKLQGSLFVQVAD